MPVIRMFIAKVKPGRTQDAVTQLSIFKRVVLDSGATHFTAYNILTGPNFPGLIFNAVYEDLAAFGAGREKIIQHPDWVPIRSNPDSPIELVNAVLVEPIYAAGDVAGSIAQTKVQFMLVVRPHRGRA